MRSAGSGVVLLWIVQCLWLGVSYAADAPPSANLNEEALKQDRIYRSAGDQVPSGYTIDRGISDYVRALASDFDQALAKLSPSERWLDIGAGSGRAVLDYYGIEYDLQHLQGLVERGRKTNSIAMSIEDRRTPLWEKTAASLAPNQLQYLYDKHLRDYTVGELGLFQIITDVIGGFSYSENLSLVMEKVLGFLELNGSFYTLLQDVHSEAGSNKPYYANAPYLTEIADADGAEVKVCSWLKSISCVEVSCDLRTDWRPPVESYRVKKVCNDVTVPTLTLMHYAAGTPPERRYRLQKRAD